MTDGRGTDRRTWSAAVLLALLLHIAIAGLLLVLRPLTPEPVQAQEPEPIRLVFTAPPEQSEPQFFSELPEDRADEAPEQPDFLSNVTSRARGETPGESNLPRMEGISDAPQVRMDPSGVSSPAADPAELVPETPPVERAEDRSSARDETEPTETEPLTPEADAPTLADLAEPAPSWLAREEPRPDPDLSPRNPAQERLMLLQPAGAQDILQHALDNPDGGTPLSGAISLNTLAWDFAPWLQRFRREFLAGWTAPYAWRMGLIQGSHVLELEIALTGELLRLDLREQQGDDALVQNSRFSLETMAPYEPLPSDFPEETLILQIQLTYHPVQRPPRRTVPVQTRRGGRRP